MPIDSDTDRDRSSGDGRSHADASPWNWVDDALATLREENLLRQPALRSTAQRPARIVLDGVPLVNFSSNDYLGLADDPRLAGAAAAAIASHGWGSGASPIVTGRGALHAELEAAIAAFEGTDDALLFPSGYAANLGVLAAIARPGDQIFSDARNHASIIDGCKLAGAAVHVYAHRDVADVERRLQQSRVDQPHDGVRRVIVTDSLFSMDGGVAPIDDLCRLARRHGAMLVVDEAHATGVLGARGQGGCEGLDPRGDVLLKVGTMSKALGSAGGFVAGARRIVQWLRNRARTQFFSTAMPEATAAASLAALRIVQEQPERRRRLLQRSAEVREALREQGWQVPPDVSQIIPVLLGTPARAVSCARQLREQGILAPPIRPPSVPEGESLLRISLSFGHQDAEIQRLLDAMRQLAPRFRPG